MNPESSTEQTIKALQAQNAQFQELIMNLAQGQQDLKALFLKKDKKKKKNGEEDLLDEETTTEAVVAKEEIA